MLAMAGTVPVYCEIGSVLVRADPVSVYCDWGDRVSA